MEQIAERSRQISEMRKDLQVTTGAAGAASGADRGIPRPEPAPAVSSGPANLPSSGQLTPDQRIAGSASANPRPKKEQKEEKRKQEEEERVKAAEEVAAAAAQKQKEEKALAAAKLKAEREAKAAKAKNLKARIVSPVFKDEKNGKYKIISFYAKKARGLMSAYLIRNRVAKAEEIAGFDSAGYRFSAKDSTDEAPVFLREERLAKAS